MSLEEIYIRLMNQYLALDDTDENSTKFLILLDLISLCEENPTATIEDYREFKALILADGPLPRPDVRVVN